MNEEISRIYLKNNLSLLKMPNSKIFLSGFPIAKENLSQFSIDPIFFVKLDRSFRVGGFYTFKTGLIFKFFLKQIPISLHLSNLKNYDLLKYI
ncbi:hypothetical protein LEP1GSC131_2715 [Leptospira kirschneri str. 200802841]|uniref:Uncharacterized protein n=1 Tax=Leptospira kirschneri str. 200802841 TaxID=1193047 RepID=A0A828XXZ0_9LEPT|nr:hypothetical protein LEP1GSC131_2715 [Leptospira kirschneri str. 200802841]